MPLFRESGGVFAPANELSVVQSGAFKSVVAAWVCDNGVFKPVFPNDREYHDPSAYYDMTNASGGTITRAEPVFEDAYNFRGWKLEECRIPFSGATNDVDWSLIEVIVIATGDALICDALSTGGNQPSCKSIEYNGVGSVNLDSYVSTNTNFAVAVRSGFVGQMAYYNYLKLTLHSADFSDKYNQQLGVRWRWHSKLHDMYFEHIFTNASMIITPV
ncbi:hypothetical protein [Pectobacterium versatile]|uniref:hypothetical protein n=1 Tax=Pectobacterium versatile TaxID=2488639 RepID=UPI001CF4157D|nr:hypothetical protein [Pectobacterium versatile]MCA6927930.1 hypothetical protein [Pectobacterium versatile]MCH5084674.1 hypothetical protein [Pectobacterium versatile]